MWGLTWREYWKAHWQRFVHAARGGMHQRITLAGVIYSLATAVVGAAAFLTANNLLFLILAAMLGTLMVAGFVSRLSLAGLQLDLELPPHPTARSSHSARLALKNDKLLMPSFSIHVAGARNSAYASRVYFPIIPPTKTVETTIDVTFARRGLHTENSFQLESRFPLGFTRRNVDLTLRREVIVYPSLEPQPEIVALGKDIVGEIAAYQRGRGHDFYRIRPYEANESSRHVDWRATAHTGALQVREFAREEEPLIEIFLESRIPPEAREWFERAVDGCAYLTWDLARRGARIRFATLGYDRIIPLDADIYSVLEYLALVTPSLRQTPLPFLDGDSATLIPLQADSVRVVFSAYSDQARQAGWQHSHFVDLSGEAAVTNASR